jgi:hypothetical protein
MTENRIAYKLTDQDGYTRRGFQGETLWLPVGKIVKPTGRGSEPCGPGVLHAYISPEVAVLMNPIHANIRNPRILKVTSDVAWWTNGGKRWTQGECTVLQEVAVPEISLELRVAFAICAAALKSTKKWAIKWLSREDRSFASAMETARAAAACVAATWEMEAARAAGAAAALASEAVEAAATRAEVARAADAAAAMETDKERFEARLPKILERAQAILRGEYPAEQYDAPYEGDA